MPTEPSKPSFPPFGRRRIETAGAALVVFCATLAAYIPAMNGGLQWDDAAHITAPGLQSWDGLWRIWSDVGSTQQYYPVLHSAFWVEHWVWGDSLLGYHLVNVLLHATSACLFAFVLARLRSTTGGRDDPHLSEWIAAAVFALHPVCVESVAWISEQKNTLSLAFYLLASLAYLRFDRSRSGRQYLLAFVLFMLAVLSKSVTATLPGALLLALAWRRGRLLIRRDVLPLVPLFIAGACAGLFTAWVERNYIGAEGAAFDLSLWERCLLAGRAIGFYLGKFFWPVNLAFIYPHWQVGKGGVGPLALVGVGALLAGLGLMRKWSRAPLLAFLFFVGSLFPVLGFFNVYPFRFSFVADHWQYLAVLGLIALVSLGSGDLARRLLAGLGVARRTADHALVALVATLLAALFTLTWRQSGLYRDAGTLYGDTLAKNPDCWMAHNNLGARLTDTGFPAAAIAHLTEAVRLNPEYADARNNLGNALSKVPGRGGDAMKEFEAALRLDPTMSQAHGNLGGILVNIPGRLAEGIHHLQYALRGNEHDPDYAEVHANLGLALEKVPGRLPEAIAELEAAARLRPGGVYEGNSLGIALDRAGRPVEAAAQFERVMAVHPDNPDAQNNLGSVLTELGRRPEALDHFRAAVRLNPNMAEAHANLGRALRDVGDGGEALAEYRRALQIAPDSAEVRNSLGTLLIRLGRFPEAVVEYGEAARLQPAVPAYRNNLGLALTKAGRVDEAILELRKALELSPAFGDAHYNLGVALQKAGRDSEAANEFMKSGRAAQ